MRNAISTTFERLNLCLVNSSTVINIVIFLYSTHITVLALLYILGTFYCYFTIIHYLLSKCITISIEIFTRFVKHGGPYDSDLYSLNNELLDYLPFFCIGLCTNYNVLSLNKCFSESESTVLDPNFKKAVNKID